jgi:FdhD protein
MSRRELSALGAAHRPVAVTRWRPTGMEHAQEELADEVPVAFVVNGEPFSVMLATPLDLEDFALGFCLTEGIIATASEFQGMDVEQDARGLSVYVSVPRERAAALAGRGKALAGRTGCGLCGETMIENALRLVPAVASTARFRSSALQAALLALPAGQQLNAITGAVHAAAFADAEGRIRLLREDVGRHNSLDKLIGALLREGVDASQGFVLMSSRASYELVHKAAVAGIPMLGAVSAPTALAVDTAVAAGITLAGFTRAGRHTVYAHPERLSD